jgi:30S ribosomal protein S31
MGKGDKKSKRGKIVIGSFGVRRPRLRKKSTEAKGKRAEKSADNAEKKAAKKPAAKKPKKETKESAE